MNAAPKRIVLTRASEANRPWRRTLEAAGAEVLVLPLVRFTPLPPPRGLDPGAFDWILFTSPQGVRAFCDAGLAPGEARVGALGGGTADTMAACGLPDDLGAKSRTGAELARDFADRVPPPAKILLPGPQQRLDEPRAGLAAAGFKVAELALYRTEHVPPSDLPPSPFADGDVVFFCSPSAVASFVTAYAERPRCVAIGTTTAVAAREAGFPVDQADEPSLAGMARACNLDLETES
jgi:uroporphyrinogen-III synthase